MKNVIISSTEDAILVLNKTRSSIEADKLRGAWSNGVRAYAIDLLNDLQEAIEGGYFFPDDLTAPKVVKKALLNGASDWSQYSWGGSSLCYDSDIARRLCAPWELRKTDNGAKRPNSREEWLDVQARALHQAERMVCSHLRAVLMFDLPGRFYN